MPTIQINKTFEMSNQDIDDIMVTALEGGINYWCGKVKVVQCPVDYTFASDVISQDGVLMLFDAESDDKWELTREKFLNGVKKYFENNAYVDIEDMMDNHDACTADEIIQYAIFNEIVFG